MTPCHAFPYPGLSQIGYASTQHPRAARWRFRVAPPQKNILGQNYGYSLSSSRTSFRSQNSLSGFKESTSSYLIITGCDPFSELKTFFLPSSWTLLFRLFRVAYTAISQFDPFPTRPSLFATTHTLLSLWSLIIDIHTFLAWLSS